MFATRLLLACGLVLAFAASGSAQFSGTEVARTGVNYAGIGTFNSFTFSSPPGPIPIRPSISGANVAFGGTLQTSGAPAFALSTSPGTASPIAVAGSTSVPGGSGPFVQFYGSPIGLSGSAIAFAGFGNPGPTNAGVFSTVTGSLAPVINNGTAYPTGGLFTNFSSPAVSGSTVVFSGTNVPAPNQPPIGVFTRTGTGSLTTIASPTTTMTGGGGTFSVFADPAGVPYLSNISGSNVVFGGRNAAGTTFGLYLATQFGIGPVATNATAIPNGAGNFTAISPIPAISGTNVAFQAHGASSQQGIYRWSAGVVSRVADRTTTVPGTTGTFNSFLFTDVAISGDRVAFRGTSTTGVSGIYTDLSGTLTKVIAIGDTFDGKTVNAVNIGQFAFEGSTIAVLVGFTNGTAGVYTFTPVPEPSGLLALGVAGLLATRLRKWR